MDVFPACAGMFPWCPPWTSGPNCFPRVRGDVPVPGSLAFRHDAFSPRARGCSLRRKPIRTRTKVFPACAGMFQFPVLLWFLSGCFPRVRGDVPIRKQMKRLNTEFSPRARGCSLPSLLLRTAFVVFPACAGMFLQLIALHDQSECFPRVRGDVPGI